MKQQTIKKWGILSLFVTASLSMNAQTKWRYTYDNVGNRTQRVVTTGSGAREIFEMHSIVLLSEDGMSVVFDGNSKLKVETIGKFGSNVFIYDLSGRELINERYETEVFSLNISALRKGIYVIVLETEGEKKSCKFNK